MSELTEEEFLNSKIITHRLTRPFVQIPMEIVTNNKLSMSAKGMYMILRYIEHNNQFRLEDYCTEEEYNESLVELLGENLVRAKELENGSKVWTLELEAEYDGNN